MPTPSLIVFRGFNTQLSDDAFKDAFAEFGTITEAVRPLHCQKEESIHALNPITQAIARDAQTGASRGFGTVIFSTEQEASDAASNMNGQS